MLRATARADARARSTVAAHLQFANQNSWVVDQTVLGCVPGQGVVRFLATDTQGLGWCRCQPLLTIRRHEAAQAVIRPQLPDVGLLVSS